MTKTTLMDPCPFVCSEDGCSAPVAEIPGYCPAHQGQPRRYDFEPLPPSAGPATLVRRRQAARALYRVYRTQFHGGGLLSSHRTEAAAERAAAKYRGGECLCGCAAVVGPGAEPREAIDVASPYAPAAGPRGRQ